MFSGHVSNCPEISVNIREMSDVRLLSWALQLLHTHTHTHTQGLCYKTKWINENTHGCTKNTTNTYPHTRAHRATKPKECTEILMYVQRIPHTHAHTHTDRQTDTHTDSYMPRLIKNGFEWRSIMFCNHLFLIRWWINNLSRRKKLPGKKLFLKIHAWTNRHSTSNIQWTANKITMTKIHL